MKNISKHIINSGRYGFILLWGYAAVVKLYNWENSRREMLQQPFPYWMSNILFWLVPLVELALVVLLLYRSTLMLGIKASVVLLSIFTLYLALGLGRAFGKIPCACGGILSGMGHEVHIVFNLLFVAVGIIAWVLAQHKGIPGEVLHRVSRKEGSKNQ